MADDAWDDYQCEPPDYGSQEYWEAHFASAPSGSAEDPAALEFEWICQDLDALVELLKPHLPQAGRVLHPGGGMSLLPLHLQRKVPGLRILSLDTSASCTAFMRERYGHYPGLQWEVEDVARLNGVTDGALLRDWRPFDAVVEKGCLDALLCKSDEEAASYIQGLADVLCVNGMCLMVSNTPARRRHLAAHFEIDEVIKLHPEEEPFGPCLYICRRRSPDAAEDEKDQK